MSPLASHGPHLRTNMVVEAHQVQLMMLSFVAVVVKLHLKLKKKFNSLISFVIKKKVFVVCVNTSLNHHSRV